MSLRVQGHVNLLEYLTSSLLCLYVDWVTIQIDTIYQPDQELTKPKRHGISYEWQRQHHSPHSKNLWNRAVQALLTTVQGEGAKQQEGQEELHTHTSRPSVSSYRHFFVLVGWVCIGTDTHKTSAVIKCWIWFIKRVLFPFIRRGFFPLLLCMRESERERAFGYECKLELVRVQEHIM